MESPMLRTLTLVFMCLYQVASIHASNNANAAELPKIGPVSKNNIHLRHQLTNSRICFEREKVGHVAFIGGSITEMNGYRPMVSSLLTKRFPETKFNFINAGISSTCSTTGAFRVKTDVFAKDKIDLFFIEFAVNDDQDAGHARRECIRGLEGILAQAYKHNPNVDIVITFFINPGMLKQITAGKMPLSMAAHQAVAKHYEVSTIHLGHEVADQIKAKTLTWKQFGGTHPGPYGNAICATMISHLLDQAWGKPLAKYDTSDPHPLPSKQLDDESYTNGRFISPHKATDDAGWTYKVPDWKSIPGGKRSRFTSSKMLSATKPGAVTAIKFNGSALGVYVVAGPDAGILEVSIDGGPYKQIDLFHRFSRGLHYPRTVMLATNIEAAGHEAKIRISKDKNAASKGHAVRIMQFCVN
jgi:lysophospholipase L1-like esterase